MVFSSMYFIFVFLPVVCCVYFLLKLFLPNKLFYRNIFLCFASLFFYAWGEPIYILLMLASIICNFFFAKSDKKIVFVFAVIFNLIFLLFFKYSGFLIENLNALFKTNFNKPELELPIGISFYTFQALSYVIDVYKKKVEPQKNIVSLALYISLFPQLIAGPIVRYIDIEKELAYRNENLDSFVSGLKDFILGLGCKVIIANNMATVADGVFGNISESCSGIIWLAAISYAFQIYFDFSGYSRMAIGLGKMFGFTFPENFRYPYCASSITDFWRRWHITLSGWFRDYVYIPLGGNRVSVIKHIRNILITWFLTGFWHGDSWNFILWGLYYGVILIFEKYITFNLLKKSESNKKINCLLKIILRMFTLFIILIGWTLFRIENISQLQFILKKMFICDGQSLFVYITQHADLCSKLIFMLPAIVASTPIYKKIFKKSENSKIVFTIELIYVFVFFAVSICLLVASTYNPFIYFRF